MGGDVRVDITYIYSRDKWAVSFYVSGDLESKGFRKSHKAACILGAAYLMEYVSKAEGMDA